MRTNSTRKHEVTSTNLAAVGYSRRYKVLDVTFRRNGETYRYYNVPRKVYDRLMRSDSKGAFYNSFIRSNKDYTPIKLYFTSDLNPIPPINKINNPEYINTHTYLVIGENGDIIRLCSSEEWAQKDALEWARKFPGTAYHAVKVIGTARFLKH